MKYSSLSDGLLGNHKEWTFNTGCNHGQNKWRLSARHRSSSNTCFVYIDNTAKHYVGVFKDRQTSDNSYKKNNVYSYEKVDEIMESFTAFADQKNLYLKYNINTNMYLVLDMHIDTDAD